MPQTADKMVARLDEIAATEVPLRTLGGVGVHLRAPDAPTALHRDYDDLDIVIRKGQRRVFEAELERLGYQPDREFNRIRGHQRQLWWGADGEHLDIFIEHFSMCHDLALGDRIEGPASGADLALEAADLLLTKLQVIELNHKDATDAAAILATHTLGDGGTNGQPRSIDLGRLRDVLSGDWGFFTTFTDNLRQLGDHLTGLELPELETVRERAAEIVDDLEAAPKSRGFNLRAKIGRRKRWYSEPDESVVDLD